MSKELNQLIAKADAGSAEAAKRGESEAAAPRDDACLLKAA